MSPPETEMGSLDLTIELLRDRFASYRAELADFVAIPSVSTDPAHAADVRRAATWVADRLRAAGPLAVRLVETQRHPVVVGSWDGRPGAPTVLVYGHLDVQPPDPVAAWESPPFTLTERDGRWYARGISDDKASMLIPILVTEAFFAGGEPPVNLRFLFEAEEEIGSPSLPGVVRELADDLACDVVLSADGGMWRPDVPNVTTSARGMVAVEVRLRGPGKDLHSGRHGGAVHNPIHALAELLSSLHDGGRVSVAGFYDGVEEPDAEALAALAALPFDEEEYRREVGVGETYGEPGFSTLARQWLRPTLEINGIGGGYQGPGSKTVIPSEAFAKVSCRLVPGQDPRHVLESLKEHLKKACPPGVELSIETAKEGAPAYGLPADDPVLLSAEAVLAEVFGRPPVRVGMGGSVPIVGVFQEVLGANTIFFSFSTGDEDIHAPNEFYRPERFRLGLEAWARLWQRLAGWRPSEGRGAV